MKGMFSFENSPVIKTISNLPEFFGRALDTGDDRRAKRCFISRRMATFHQSVDNRVNETMKISTEYKVSSNVFNYIDETTPFLTSNLGSVDQQ
jgi:hypothetical protein